MTNIFICTVVMSKPTRVREPGHVSVPALAVLHVRVGSGLQQSLCNPSHTSHDLCRVFFGAK